VGQAKDVASRWSDHAKCGLGIDTPANNKLYQAMEKYGLWSFSWELLEECPQEQLNEKEKFYIDLYDSYNYGMNSNKGVSK
jgi:group I intron endonuclease